MVKVRRNQDPGSASGHAPLRAQLPLPEILEQILSTSHEGIWVLDETGRTAVASARLAQMLSCQREELGGRSLLDFVDQEGQRWAEGILTRPSPGAAETSSLQLRRPDGSGLRARMTISPLLDEKDSLRGWVAVLTDLSDRESEAVRQITDHRATEQALRESEEELRGIFNAVSDVIFIHDAETGAILSANERVTELFGYTPEELSTMTVGDLSSGEPPYTQAEAARRVSSAAGPKGLPPFEWHSRHRDGHLFWVEVNLRKTIIRGLPRLAAVVRDVSVRKRAEQTLRTSEALFRAAFDSAAIGVAITDAGFGILRVNAAFSRIIGYAESELVGRSFREITHPDDLEASVAAAERLRSGQSPSETLEKRYVRRDGRIVWCITSLAALPDAAGGPGQFVAQLNDISERKALEEEQQQATRSKDDFLATLGHELRNPLAVLSNAVYLLERLDPGDERTLRARSMMGRQVAHLSQMVDDLLDVSRIARGKITLRLKPLELGGLCRETAEDLRPELEAKELGFVLDLPSGPVWVRGDRTRLAQVVANLLNNARKFTPSGGRVTLAVRGDAVSGRAVLQVADTGVGILPEAQSQLFEPFSQVTQDPARRGGGLGLGLALVRGLSALHGGSVSVFSEGAGQGATFSVSLPLTDASGAGAQPSAAAPQGAPRRVLLIEDNADFAEALRLSLELGGHEVLIAPDGVKGLEVARRLLPDAIICDIGLPGPLDGHDVARAIRADPSLAGAHLIALTGFGQESDKRRAEAAGFDEHLTKPASPEVVLARLGRASPPS